MHRVPSKDSSKEYCLFLSCQFGSKANLAEISKYSLNQSIFLPPERGPIYKLCCHVSSNPAMQVMLNLAQ